LATGSGKDKPDHAALSSAADTASIFLILKFSQFCQKGQQRFGSVAFPEQDLDRREQDNAFRESAYLPTMQTLNARNREH
jgi:hypothetical protein